MAFCYKSLSDVANIAAEQGLVSCDIIDMSRNTRDSTELVWQLLFLQHPQMPFFIDWRGSPHPALSTATGCSLGSFSISSETPSVYERLLAGLELPIAVTSGTNGFCAQLNIPKGTIALDTW